MKKTKKLGKKQHKFLCEALRRYTRFHQGEELTQASLGLGTITEFSSIMGGGFMTYANVDDTYIYHKNWFKLTEKGAQVVQQWLESGWNHTKIELLNPYFRLRFYRTYYGHSDEIAALLPPKTVELEV